MTSSWMLVAGFLFAAMAVFVKLGAEHFGAAELAFYRSVLTLIMAGAVLAWQRDTIRSAYIGTHVLRGIVGCLSLIGYFYSITKLPVAMAQTLNYTSPLFLAIATTVVMRERFSPWLIVAIVLGFVGVAMLLQPTFSAGQEGAAMIGLFSGVMAAWAYLSVRTLGKLGESNWRVVFWFGLVSTVICLVWHLSTASFHPVTAENWWMLVGIGVAGTGGQFAMTRAYGSGNTLVVGAYSYSSILFAAFATLIFWDEIPTPLAWAGMAVIVAGGLLAMRVERTTKIEEPS